MTFDEWWTSRKNPAAFCEIQVREAWEAGRKERDFEWWQHVVLVDNVEPTPEAAKAFVVMIGQYGEEQAAIQQRELSALAAESVAEGVVEKAPGRIPAKEAEYLKDVIRQVARAIRECPTVAEAKKIAKGESQ